MEKKSNVGWIIAVVILSIVIVVLIGFIILNAISNSNTKPIETNTVIEEETQSENDKLLIKSEVYSTDLNHDNDKEKTQINYYGIEDEEYKGVDYRNYKYEKVEIVILEDGKTSNLEVIGNFSSSDIVDINSDDYFSEIVLIEEVNDEQYKDSIFIEYDGREISTIKVNYSEDSVKTYNYINNENKKVQFISRGIDGKMEISNGDNYVTVVSQLGKMEKYVLNESHEFELQECKLIKDKEFYQEVLPSVQDSIKVYQSNDLESQSYGAQETSNMEILQVLDNWLMVKQKSSGAVTYVYIDDIKDYLNK